MSNTEKGFTVGKEGRAVSCLNKSLKAVLKLTLSNKYNAIDAPNVEELYRVHHTSVDC